MNQHAAPRRVLRSRRDRVLAGVAAGLGNYFGLDPAVVRLAFVALAFVGGIGVLLYLAAWAIVPDEPASGGGTPSAPQAGSRSTAVWTIVILVTAVLVLAGVGRIGLGLEPRIIWPLTLIGFGIALLWLRANQPPAASASIDREVAPTAGPPESGEAVTDPTAPSAPWTVAPINESPLRRAAPILGRILLVVALAFVAIVATAAAILAVEGPGSITFTPLEAIITGVVVILAAVAGGIGLHRVVDALVVAAFVISVLAVFGWIGPPFHGGFGTRDIRPVDAASIAREYHLAGGELVLDLGAVDAAALSRSVSAAVAAGRLDVVVPDDVTVVLDAHVDAGVIDAFGRRESGVAVSRHSVERGNAVTLRIDARVGFGDVLVERASSHRLAEPRPTEPSSPPPAFVAP